MQSTSAQQIDIGQINKKSIFRSAGDKVYEISLLEDWVIPGSWRKPRGKYKNSSERAKMEIASVVEYAFKIGYMRLSTLTMCIIAAQ